MAASSSSPVEKCHLLTLPAELRLRIYEEILSPGVLCLTRTSTKRYAVQPAISPQFLSACRQIYNEASLLLYFDNEVTLSIDVHDTFAPVINESRLPQSALEKLQHLCLVCDGTSNLWGSYGEDIDFTPLSALVSLKSLRLCMLYGTAPDGSIRDFASSISSLTKQILARIPSTTQIHYEIETETHQADVVEYIRAKASERYRNPDQGRSFTTIDGSAGGSFARAIHVVPADMIREAVRNVEEVKGSKAGAKKDVFEEFRKSIPRGFSMRC